MYEEFETDSNIVLTVMMGIILLAFFIVVGFVLLFPRPVFPYAEYLYPFSAVTILSFFGARGKFESPTIIQFLIIFAISLVPIFGTLYVAFYAGICISKSHKLIYTIISLFVLIIIVFLLREVNLNTLSSLFTSKVVSTSAPTPSMKTATSTSVILNTATSESITQTQQATPTAEDIRTDCVLWSEVTLNQVGEIICVYGDYLEIIERDDGTHVMTFSIEAGSFNIWSNPKPMWWYLENIQGACIIVQGEIISSGVRPVILLGSQDTMEACP
jgi:hypothetical protein